MLERSSEVNVTYNDHGYAIGRVRPVVTRAVVMC